VYGGRDRGITGDIIILEELVTHGGVTGPRTRRMKAGHHGAFVVELLGMNMVIPIDAWNGIRAGQYRRNPIKCKKNSLDGFSDMMIAENLGELGEGRESYGRKTKRRLPFTVHADLERCPFCCLPGQVD